MAPTSFIAHSIDYGRELARAGIDGALAGERLSLASSPTRLGISARQALAAAALGGGLALVACKLVSKHKVKLAPILACGTAAFCADFMWRTRDVSSKMLRAAESEMGKVSDKHWLESHPIDYA